jgi:hypothetical protein
MSYNVFTVQINRKALAIAPSVTIGNVAIVGTCTGVAAGSWSAFNAQSIGNAGVGPAANLGNILTSVANLVTIFGAAALSTETLSAVALAPTRVGSSTGTIAVTGTPVDSFLIRVECITTGATNTTAVFRYSLDDGQTFVETFTGSSTKVLNAKIVSSGSSGISTFISTGLTITLSVGTYTQGDVFALEVFAPQIDTTDADVGSMVSCFNLLTTKDDYNFVVIANTPNFGASDATNFTSAQAMHAKLVTNLQTSFGISKYIQGVASVPRAVALTDETGATYLGNLSTITSTSDRLAVSVGYVCLPSAGSYRAWVPAAWLAVYRILQLNNPRHSIYRSQDGNFGNIIQPGTMAGMTGLLATYTGLQQYGSTYDERATVSGNAGYATPLGFLALTTDTNGPAPVVSNFYFAQGNAHTQNTSDFFEWQLSILMDVFIRAVLASLWTMKGSDFNGKADGTGQLLPADATNIENTVDGFVQKTMVDGKNWVSRPGPGVKFVTIDRTNNFVSTGTINAKGRMAAPGYAKQFNVQFSYTL